MPPTLENIAADQGCVVNETSWHFVVGDEFGFWRTHELKS